MKTPAPPMLAAALLLAAAIFFSAYHTRRSFQQWRNPPPIDLQEQALYRLRTYARVQGEFGYLTDADPIDLGDVQQAKGIELTQFILAPARVRNRTDRTFVIGRFENPAAAPDLLARHRLRPLIDFGSGVMLLQQRGDGPP